MNQTVTMCWKLVTLFVLTFTYSGNFCLLHIIYNYITDKYYITEVLGLVCNNCTDAETCKNPNSADCDGDIALKNFSSTFSQYFNPPTDTNSYACIAANITFQDTSNKPILTLGCGLQNFNSISIQTIKTSSVTYNSCNTDNCNTFSKNSPSTTTSSPTQSTTTNLKCLQCQGDQCLKGSKDFNVYTATCDTSNSYVLYQELTKYLNIPNNMIPNEFECISFNGSFNTNSIIYEGCVPKGIEICKGQSYSDSKAEFQCKQCQSDLCNNLNDSISEPENKINCYTCESEPCGNRNSVECSDSEVLRTFNYLSQGYNLTATSGSGQYKCLTLNATISKEGQSGKFILF